MQGLGQLCALREQSAVWGDETGPVQLSEAPNTFSKSIKTSPL